MMNANLNIFCTFDVRRTVRLEINEVIVLDAVAAFVHLNRQEE